MRYRANFQVELEAPNEDRAREIQRAITAAVFLWPEVMTLAGDPLVDANDLTSLDYDFDGSVLPPFAPDPDLIATLEGDK
jgi:hypothetical protein